MFVETRPLTDEEIKLNKIWIDTMRKYPTLQRRHGLKRYDDNDIAGYCSLGLACLMSKISEFDENDCYDGNGLLPPNSVWTLYGWNSNNPYINIAKSIYRDEIEADSVCESISRLNDSIRLSYEMIANLVEEALEALEYEKISILPEWAYLHSRNNTFGE